MRQIKGPSRSRTSIRANALYASLWRWRTGERLDSPHGDSIDAGGDRAPDREEE